MTCPEKSYSILICLVHIQGNRIKNFGKIQVANFQMIAFRRLYSKIKNALKTMIDNQALTF
ncbi:hypothetical protein CLI72_08475 [Porphyromonas gingivalis]|nr:hypothetical protein CLI81_02705 [Porphyromonas gingivalis]PDP79933.1 hypothetical protein CLI73_00010 [Porphyromonas gingivalis]PDP80598.1 hypothetical protein CLI72_08475 [Porphyromonas gingivalis]RZQ66937.1 hypothetical protein EW639_07180 [Porphyromonas gingivalis]